LSTAAPYEALVAAHGLSRTHRLLVDAVDPGSRVLDVGCSTGYLAAVLAATGCLVVGVEQDERAAARARARDVLGDVLVGSVDDEDVLARVAEHGPYDAIVCGDVLAHVPEPDATLRTLAAQLAPGGRVALSVPNVAHWTARWALLRGRLPLEAGAAARPHLRWFTRAGAHALMGAAGLRVMREQAGAGPVPLQAQFRSLRHLAAPLARARPELFAQQLILVGAPT
jgi:2-polyprenyl-3-methyl-5-hydroxy-6-metoxy-1,4-benzoquinol methylase